MILYKKLQIIKNYIKQFQIRLLINHKLDVSAAILFINLNYSVVQKSL